jgi:putative flippase GtrA
MAKARIQLLRFAAVGVSNTLITLASYALGIRAGLPYLIAGALSYALGGVNGFAVNRTWTFGHRGRIAPAAARYGAVTALGIAANLALLHAAISTGIPRSLGEVAAIAPVTLLTFALNRAWAFASDDESPYPPALDAGRPRRGLRRPARHGGPDPAAAGDRGG